MHAGLKQAVEQASKDYLAAFSAELRGILRGEDKDALAAKREAAWERYTGLMLSAFDPPEQTKSADPEGPAQVVERE